MERLIPVVLALAIVAFAWLAFGSLSALLVATAKLTAIFFIIAAAGELTVSRSKSSRSRP